MKQSHWLLCVAKNCDWSRKITPLSRLNRAVAYRGMKLKTYSESRIDRTVKSTNLKENALKVKSVFFSSEQPCEPKSLDVALNIAGVENIRSENLRLRSTLEAIRFELSHK